MNKLKKPLKWSSITWPEWREDLLAINPELTRLIDELDPGPDLTCFKVAYPYGNYIIKQGHLLAPNADEVPEHIMQQLDYARIPWMLSLNKASEIFFDMGQTVSPLSCLINGELIGDCDFHHTRLHIQSTQFWNITAGVRTTFMLPKVTDSKSHKRLWREFGVPYEPPRNLWEHWDIFKTIANHPSLENPWHSEMIFFTKAWIDKLQHSDNPAWNNLKLYMNHQIAKHSEYFYLRSTISTLKNMFKSGYDEEGSSIKTNPYIFDTAKHILTIATGAVPGYRPTGKGEFCAPANLIETAYIDVYDLKGYLPIIMRPTHSGPSDAHIPRYYSVAQQTLMESHPEAKPKNLPNLISDLRDVSYIIKNLESKLNKFSDFKFYHTHASNEGNILSASQMPNYNDELLITYADYSDRNFPSSSPFVRGCVQITPKRD